MGTVTVSNGTDSVVIPVYALTKLSDELAKCSDAFLVDEPPSVALDWFSDPQGVTAFQGEDATTLCLFLLAVLDNNIWPYDCDGGEEPANWDTYDIVVSLISVVRRATLVTFEVGNG